MAARENKYTVEKKNELYSKDSDFSYRQVYLFWKTIIRP